MTTNKYVYLILGVTGMAGHVISTYLKSQGHKVIGVSRSIISNFTDIELDVLDSEKLKSILISTNFDYIVNCVGVLNHFAENNKVEAIYLNSYLPHFIESVVKNTNKKLIHISTDCVFSGDRGGYKENDFTDGYTFYAKSKALGELVNSATLRTSIVGPDLRENGIGLFNWFMTQTAMSGYECVIWSGITTLQLAKVVELFSDCYKVGIFNIVNNTVINKKNLLDLFNKYICNDSKLIQSSNNLKSNKSLVNSKCQNNFFIPSYNQMIVEMFHFINSNIGLYPHYEI